MERTEIRKLYTALDTFEDMSGKAASPESMRASMRSVIM